jgi:apolipoprotein N-acyltransferase
VTWGADNLHVAGFVQGLPEVSPQSSAAFEAPYVAKGVWWLIASALLLWAAEGAVRSVESPDSTTLFLWGALLTLDGAAAYWSGTNLNQFAPQVVWSGLYVAALVAAIVFCIPAFRDLRAALLGNRDTT